MMAMLLFILTILLLLPYKRKNCFIDFSPYVNQHLFNFNYSLFCHLFSMLQQKGGAKNEQENINLTEQIIKYDSKMYSQKLKTRFWFGSTCGLGLVVIALILL